MAPRAPVRQSSIENSSETEDQLAWDFVPEPLHSLNDDSATFLGRCLYVTFGLIMRERKLLPEDAFVKTNIANYVKSYVMSEKNNIGLRVASKFAGACEALSHGYLKELAIVVSDNNDDPDDVLEVFSWRIAYLDSNATGEFVDNDGNVLARVVYKGEEYAKRQTIALLVLVRRLCRDVLSPLPPNCYAGLRISYTDRTPSYYQAEGFYSTQNMYDLRPDAHSLALSSLPLSTAQHALMLSVHSVCIANAQEAAQEISEMIPAKLRYGDESVVITEKPYLAYADQQDDFMDQSFPEVNQPGLEAVVVESPPVTETGLVSDVEKMRRLDDSMTMQHSSLLLNPEVAPLDNDTYTATICESNIAADVTGCPTDDMNDSDPLATKGSSSTPTIGSHSSSSPPEPRVVRKRPKRKCSQNSTVPTNVIEKTMKLMTPIAKLPADVPRQHGKVERMNKYTPGHTPPAARLSQEQAEGHSQEVLVAVKKSNGRTNRVDAYGSQD